MNKKFMKLMFGGVITLFLIGCSNSASNKIENALVSLQSKDYETSISLLEEVLEKNPENNEAKDIITIISDYKKALELLKEEKIDEAKEISDNIAENYNNYIIKGGIKSLISDLEKRINDKEIELVDDMFKKARALFDEGKYAECKEFLDLSVSPKVKSIKNLPKDTNIALASLYSTYEESLAIEEEKDTNVEVAVQEQTYSAPSNTSGSSSNPNNVPAPSPSPTPTPTPAPTPSPEPTPVVPDESSNPYSDGLKYINGFEYVVRDGSHWQAQLYYNLVCAGMYNKITFNTPAGEMKAMLFYYDDTSFEYESSYGGSYGTHRLGTYNGRVVFCVQEFSY